ncbi:hypothetical protein [Spirosoma rigui]|uniref:hypothetical protein n=1 Tax=Spirosoma rigui TaxID=564064 RepID=UPI0009B189E5|nr:hypothetical protein [Spirosoma rigui]
MNTFFALALACTLSTAPKTDDKLTSRESTTYMVTDNLALWLTETGKLKVAVGQHPGNGTIEFRGDKGALYHGTVDLRKGIHQTFDLSEIADGTYQIQVTVGKQVTTKTIQIERNQNRVVRLS